MKQDNFDLYVDGSFNAKNQKMAIGWVAITPDMEFISGGKVIDYKNKNSGVAEIMAVIEGLHALPEYSHITVFTDYEPLFAIANSSKQKHQEFRTLIHTAANRHKQVTFEHIRESASNLFHNKAHIEAFNLTI